jgi:hypothetical protein
LNELTKRINDLLIEFNKSFKLEANIVEDNGEQVAVGLKIQELKNDGSEFVSQIFDMFSQIINASGEYELVYDEEKGIAIAKKVVTVEYIFDDKK